MRISDWSSDVCSSDLRRERTRHLIELGGLVQKAGLVELADDDRATLYGALLDCTARVQGDDAGNVLALWKRRGKRAFRSEGHTSELKSLMRHSYAVSCLKKNMNTTCRLLTVYSAC